MEGKFLAEQINRMSLPLAKVSECLLDSFIGQNRGRHIKETLRIAHRHAFFSSAPKLSLF